MRLTFEIVASSPEQERLQRIWLRHLEKSGLLGAHLQASFECECYGNEDQIETETDGLIKATELRKLSNQDVATI